MIQELIIKDFSLVDNGFMKKDVGTFQVFYEDARAFVQIYF